MDEGRLWPISFLVMTLALFWEVSISINGPNVFFVGIFYNYLEFQDMFSWRLEFLDLETFSSWIEWNGNSTVCCNLAKLLGLGWEILAWFSEEVISWITVPETIFLVGLASPVDITGYSPCEVVESLELLSMTHYIILDWYCFNISNFLPTSLPSSFISSFLLGFFNQLTWILKVYICFCPCYHHPFCCSYQSQATCL